jgi:hypothetical protein
LNLKKSILHIKDHIAHQCLKSKSVFASPSP